MNKGCCAAQPGARPTRGLARRPPRLSCAGLGLCTELIRLIRCCLMFQITFASLTKEICLSKYLFCKWQVLETQVFFSLLLHLSALERNLTSAFTGCMYTWHTLKQSLQEAFWSAIRVVQVQVQREAVLYKRCAHWGGLWDCFQGAPSLQPSSLWNYNCIIINTAPPSPLLQIWAEIGLEFHSSVLTAQSSAAFSWGPHRHILLSWGQNTETKLHPIFRKTEVWEWVCALAAFVLPAYEK